MDQIFDINKGICIVCSLPTEKGRITCGKSCHEEFIKYCEDKFGKVKIVVDITTGIEYEIPTRIIIESGLKWEELHKFPVHKF